MHVRNPDTLLNDIQYGQKELLRGRCSLEDLSDPFLIETDHILFQSCNNGVKQNTSRKNKNCNTVFTRIHESKHQNACLALFVKRQEF